MEENLEVASAIEKTSGGIAYDSICKGMLANKQIVAQIMKNCVPEYREVPIEEIPNYIKETIFNNDKIIGMNTEDEKIDGALIRYDVLFQAIVPGKKEKIGLLINLEAQNQDNPGYSLVSRAIYYCARLLSRQKNAPEGFQKSEFDDMKKVYSIWLCFNHSEDKDDVINYYAIKEECKGNEWHSPKDDYDLIQAIMIYPSKDYDYYDNKHDLLEMLNILFVSTLSAKEKKRLLTQNYGIKMTQKLDEEVERMCNLSQGVYERGMQEGKIEGKIEGEKIGKIEESAKNVKALIKKKKMSLNEAFDLLDVDEELKPQVLELLEKADSEE